MNNIDSRLHLLNTSIIPSAPGRFIAHIETISVEEARALMKGSTIVSHIGHASTAQMMSAVLGQEVTLDRTPLTIWWNIEVTYCLCFQLRGRGEEGRIYTAEEVEAIGFDFRYMRIIPG